MAAPKGKRSSKVRQFPTRRPKKATRAKRKRAPAAPAASENPVAKLSSDLDAVVTDDEKALVLSLGRSITRLKATAQIHISAFEQEQAKGQLMVLELREKYGLD